MRIHAHHGSLAAETAHKAVGEITWRIGGRAPDKKVAAAVTDTFKQGVRGGKFGMRPIVRRSVEKEVLEKLRAKR